MSCTQKVCLIYASLTFWITLGLGGLIIAAVNLNKYSFGLYFALLSIVGFILSMAFCILTPEASAQPSWLRIAQKRIRRSVRKGRSRHNQEHRYSLPFDSQLSCRVDYQLINGLQNNEVNRNVINQSLEPERRGGDKNIVEKCPPNSMVLCPNDTPTAMRRISQQNSDSISAIENCLSQMFENEALHSGARCSPCKRESGSDTGYAIPQITYDMATPSVSSGKEVGTQTMEENSLGGSSSRSKSRETMATIVHQQMNIISTTLQLPHPSAKLSARDLEESGFVSHIDDYGYEASMAQVLEPEELSA